MSKIRVTHVITELDIGGAERQLALLLPQLQEYFDNHVICVMGHGPIGEELVHKGIPVYYLDGKSIYNLQTLWRLYSKLKDIRPKASIGYLIYADVLNRLAGRLAHVPTIISSQRSSFIGRGYLRFFDWLTKALVSLYIVQTKYAKQQLTQLLSLIPDTLHVIPNAVSPLPTSSAQRTPHSAALLKSSHILTCVANLKPGKGHAELLQAFTIVLETHTAAHLLLVGDGPLREKLRHLAQSLGIQEHVHFLGTRSDIGRILAASDIFVLPTHGEGMSNALLEAMAHGVACITSDIPSNAEVVRDNKDGILSPVGDEQQLADNINHLLASGPERTRLGTAAKKRVETLFAPKIVAKRWREIVEETDQS